MITKIDVTEEHIKRGIRYQCNSCPVALAVGDKVTSYVKAGCTYIRLIDPITRYGNDSLLKQYRTPKFVADFIERFDAGAETGPFSFELNIPQEYLK